VAPVEVGNIDSFGGLKDDIGMKLRYSLQEYYSDNYEEQEADADPASAVSAVSSEAPDGRFAAGWI